MKLRYERGVLADLEEIFSDVAADNPDAAGRLVARIENAAARIAVHRRNHPQAWVPALAGWQLLDCV
jgi:plasmid stabilization system protein ParE